MSEGYTSNALNHHFFDNVQSVLIFFRRLWNDNLGKPGGIVYHVLRVTNFLRFPFQILNMRRDVKPISPLACMFFLFRESFVLSTSIAGDFFSRNIGLARLGMCTRRPHGNFPQHPQTT